MASFNKPYVCTLSPELVEKAQKELNEKAAWRSDEIQALRDMIKLNPGLHSRMDDAFLIRFLRARKFDYDRAYELLVNYYQIRADNINVFRDLTPSTVSQILEDGVIFPLPKRTPEGCQVYFFRPGKWNPDVSPIFDILRMNIMSLEVLIEDEATQVNGLVMVGDMSTMTMNHAKNFSREYGRLTLAVLQEAFPLRFKGLHINNEPSVFSYVFSLVKPFMKEKTQQRLKIHGSDRESLYKHVPKDCLPEELGGTLGPADELAKKWKETMKSREQFFVDMQQFNIVSRHQITKKQDEPVVENVVGTFRKLNVD